MEYAIVPFPKQPAFDNKLYIENYYRYLTIFINVQFVPVQM